MTNSLLLRAKDALALPLKAREVRFELPLSEYVLHLEDNLLPGALSQLVIDDFSKGAGRELEGKMRAPHSSSALVLNHFFAWRPNPRNLQLLGHTNFESLAFEVECSSGLPGTPPHLDVLLRNRSGVIAVESKCTEYLKPKKAVFSPAYNSILDSRRGSHWYQLISSLRANPTMFCYLDVAQLIKHFLGVRNCYPGEQIMLLYLYWEPSDASLYTTFKNHREELVRFSKMVRGDNTFGFEYMRYRDLWQEWSDLQYPHLAKLRQRYDVPLRAPLETIETKPLS